MPLVVTTLELDILSILNKLKDDNSEDQTKAINKYAKDLSIAIDKYIKTATVVVQPGQVVSTAGSAVAQTGATTSPGTGSIT